MKELIPKVTAIAWTKNLINALTRWHSEGRIRLVQAEMRELELILQYLKAAPAPISKRRLAMEYSSCEIRIKDGDKEIAMWNIDEWIEDPEVVFSIVNAAVLALTKPGTLSRCLRRKKERPV